MDEDVADGGLIDVTGLDLGDLLTDVDETSIVRALERILTVNENGGAHWFQASI